MTTPVEILIHISAPSRGSDDVKYRRQAQGFLDFKVATRHDVAPRGLADPDSVLQHQVPARVQLGLEEGSEVHSGTGKVACTSGKDKEASREDTFATTTPNTDNYRKSTGTQFRPSRGSNVLHPANIQVDRTPFVPRPNTAPSHSSKTPPPPLHRRSFSDSWETPPSVIPDSQPSNASNISRKRGRPPVTSSQETTQSTSPLAKRARIQAPHAVVQQASSSTGSNGPHESIIKQPVVYPTLPSLSSSGPEPSSVPAPSPPLIARIHPPPPPVSTAPFTTHLTQYLIRITNHLPIAKHFQPKWTNRPLRTHERGYWEIPIRRDQWTTGLWEKFLDFVEQFVGGGRAGWGVWAEWERAGREKTKDGLEKEKMNLEKAIAGNEQESVRIYCWGEVVGHVWLVLLLATSRKVKGMGARWVDGAGEVVLGM